MKTSVLTFPEKQPLTFLLIATAIWLAIYQSLISLSEFNVQQLPVARGNFLAKALYFNTPYQ